MAYQGYVIIERAEKKAKSDRGFAELLGAVWQNTMTDDIWERVKAERDTSPKISETPYGVRKPTCVPKIQCWYVVI